MRTHTTLWAALAPFVMTLAGSDATAAVFCVNPNLPSCLQTIQAAVDAAGDGDTIRISSGIYYENVEVPPARDGLQIVGAGRLSTIIDPSPFAAIGVTHTGPAISIASRDVQVRNLGVRNGNTHGIVTSASGTLVQGVSVKGAQGVGLRVDSPTASGVQFVANEIRGTFGPGIQSAGYGTVIKSNVIDAQSHGIFATGNAAQITGNRIVSQLASGIVVLANGPVVTGNDVRYGLNGIDVSGNNPVVLRNRVTGPDSFGIFVECTGCFGGAVSFNTVSDAGDDAISAVSDDSGLHVDGNTVVRSGAGISLDGTGIFASLNRVTDVGFRNDASCFAVFGDDNVLARNNATRCAGAGFHFNGNRNYAERNTALNTLENGFTVDGVVGTTLSLNKASFAAAQGFAVVNSAQGTVLTGNTGSGSRLDFCDDGTGTRSTDNAFGTSSATPSTDCLIAH